MPRSFIVGESGRYSRNVRCVGDLVAFVSLYLGAAETSKTPEFGGVMAGTRGLVLYAGIPFLAY